MEELRTCPLCGYRNGFHVSYLVNDEEAEMGLICPACGSSFGLKELLGGKDERSGEREEEE